MTEFLDNNLSYTDLVTRAKNAINDNDLDKALTDLTMAYQMRQTIQVNHLLVTVLVAQNQYQEAQIYADEFVDSYLNDKQDAQMYLNLTLNNHYFLHAWEVLRWLPTEWQRTFKQMIKTAEDDYRTTQEQTIKTIARHFYHLSDGDVADQQKRLMSANKLPRDEYVTGAKFILIDPFLTQMSRVTVLDQLRRINFVETVSFLNIKGEVTKVVPAKLQDISSDSTYQAVIAALSLYEKQLGTDMVHGLNEQAKLLLMMAYPELELVVADATSWVAGLISETFSLPMPSEPGEQEYWRKKLQKSLINFFN